MNYLIMVAISKLEQNQLGNKNYTKIQLHEFFMNL